MTVEDHDLRVKGLHVLNESLGLVEAERFVMLMNRDAGDYTEWRRTHLYQDMSLEELAEKAREAGDEIRLREKILAKTAPLRPNVTSVRKTRSSSRPAGQVSRRSLCGK